MKIISVADLLFNCPLAISPSKLSIILSVLAPRLQITEANGIEIHSMDDRAFEGVKTEAAAARAPFTSLPNGVALIDVSGSLVNRTRGLDAASGLQSYKSLSASHMAAVQDESIKHILLRMDTPGGQTSGLADFADQIYSHRGIKPITAIVDDQCFSAGMWIASQADEIVLSRTGGAGSIGVLAVHTDRSQAMEKGGVKVTMVSSGSKKTLLSDSAPLTEDGLEFLSHLVSKQADMFIEAVARGRGLSAQSIKAQEAGVYFGSDAIATGLVDRIEAPDQAIRNIINQYASRRNPEPARAGDGRISRAAEAMRIACV